VGAGAIAAPILISVRAAWYQSLAYEKSRVTGYATDTLRRSDETGVQIHTAFQQLRSSGLAACSPQEIDLMRKIDLDSSYLRAVGRITGDELICTSLGTTKPIPVGPPTLVIEGGAENRLNVRLPIAGDRPITIVSTSGFAILIDPTLPLDTATEGPGIALALFVPSSQSSARVVAGSGQIRPGWYRNIPKGSTFTFVDAGYVVSVARSARGDIAAVAAAPQTYVLRQVQHFIALFVPMGVLCGLALVAAVIYISRVQFSLASMLRAAARRKEFFVEYQPVVDLKTRRWIGAEALVRWQRGGMGVVRPDLFIPTAEESGVIKSITRCVAEIVAQDLPPLLALDPSFCIAVNLSAADLQSRATVDVLERTALLGGAGPGNLMVEATESGFLQGKDTGEMIRAIRALGIGVAIDDFGTGYSSLSRLETLGPDALKIDKSFVDSIGAEGATRQVVHHIIDMGHSLHLKMVAEGVETEAQAEFLRQSGVGYAQGWLFGRPMPVRELRDALELQRKDERSKDPLAEFLQN
jgi:sensor c-di-GMP phosphodiesterase-like protein